jgi:hypothetical protein
MFQNEGIIRGTILLIYGLDFTDQEFAVYTGELGRF